MNEEEEEVVTGAEATTFGPFKKEQKNQRQKEKELHR